LEPRQGDGGAILIARTPFSTRHSQLEIRNFGDARQTSLCLVDWLFVVPAELLDLGVVLGDVHLEVQAIRLARLARIHSRFGIFHLTDGFTDTISSDT
jgi:hypothetical protein